MAHPPGPLTLAYFHRFHLYYVYHSAITPRPNFNLLSARCQWVDREHDRELKLFIGAVLQDFIAAFPNVDFNDTLATAQFVLLCMNPPGYDVPLTMMQCKLELRRIHINIFDFIAGRYDRTHTYTHQLRRYTRDNKMFFPLEHAKDRAEHGILYQVLLKKFFY